jgi:hypothetical protein
MRHGNGKQHEWDILLQKKSTSLLKIFITVEINKNAISFVKDEAVKVQCVMHCQTIAENFRFEFMY